MEELDGEPTVTVRAPANVLPSLSEDCVCFVTAGLSLFLEAPFHFTQLSCHSSEFPLARRLCWVVVFARFLLFNVLRNAWVGGLTPSLTLSCLHLAIPFLPSLSCWAGAPVNGLGPSRELGAFFVRRTKLHIATP